MSPTALFLLPAGPVYGSTGAPGTGGVYPGYGRTGGAGRGYTGYPPGPSQGPIYLIFKVKGPTHGQMKAFLDPAMRFLRQGLDKGPEKVQN